MDDQPPARAATGGGAAFLVDLLAAGPARRASHLVLPISRHNRFLVPLGANRATAASLASYAALRPRPQRLVRRALAAGGRAGVLSLLPVPRAAIGDGALVAWLRERLDEPALVFACGLRRSGAFATPVLQLFRPDGTAVGYAKLGWDPVTRTQVAAEAAALVRTVGLATLRAPRLLAAGTSDDLEVCVTAPMPPRVQRLSADFVPSAAVLREVACLDGALERTALGASVAVARARAAIGSLPDPVAGELDSVLDELVETHGATELEFGRWHGDWVPWNMARDPEMPRSGTPGSGALWVWDWEYSRSPAPLGFDALHWHYQLAHVVAGRAAADAMLDAARAARGRLEELGLDDAAIAAIAAAHRLEVRLRAEVAVAAGAAREPVCDVPAALLLRPGGDRRVPRGIR